MRFEWDPEKDRRNLAKHGIGFDEALLVWWDALRLTLFDREEDGEGRWIVVGAVAVVVVVHFYPDPDDDTCIGIISPRQATRQERRRYKEGE